MNLNRSGSRRFASPTVVAALIFVACHSESITDLAPEVLPLVNKVVFDSDRDDLNGELYAIDLDDGSLTRLTNSPFRDFCPAVSPDGLRIAFYSSRLGGQLALYIMYADGSHVRYVEGPVNPDDKLADPGASCPKWSGDGSRVIYLRYDALPATGDVSSLRSVSASGSGVTEVAAGAVFYGEALSPDGSRALFSRNVPNNSELTGVFVANVNGGGELALARDGYDPYPSQVSWSPDGRTVVYSCPRDLITVITAGGALCFSGPAGENPRRIEVDQFLFCGEVEWSPDSSIVLCSAWGIIYRIDAVSGTISEVALGTRGRWSGDGARIVFVKGSPDAQDIIVADVSGAHAISLTRDAFNDDHPSFGPPK